MQSGVDSGSAVEDSKLLEACNEHILFYWDDIMACLTEELVEEEVLELNRIDKIRKGDNPDQQAREDLMNMLFEKNRTFNVNVPDMGS